MHHAAVECKKTIAVLSPDYLASMYTEDEWTAAWVARKLIPVRVRVCEPPGLLSTIGYCDLVGLNKADAREALIEAVSGTRIRPTDPVFPGPNLSERAFRPVDSENLHEAFPGCGSSVPLDKLSAQIRSAVDLLGLLRTTRMAFDAQARVRDDLVLRVQNRLVLNPYMQYEEFFSRYFECFEPYERKIFATIRSFTSSVLYENNKKVLRLIETNSVLERRIQGVTELKNHLIIWLAKYDDVFMSTPQMSLLYVGPDAGVPFPAQVEGNIWRYLKEKGETDSLLLVEPPPSSTTEETPSSGDWYVKHSLEKRWLLKEISEINARLLEERDKTVLRDLETTLATRLQTTLYAGLDIQHICKSTEIVNAVKSIIKEAQPDWPKELLSVLAEAQSAIEHPHLWEFDSLLPLLPSLAFQEEQRNPQTDLKQLWKSVREDLTACAIDWLQPKR
jgi:hypothetical protein